MISSIICVAQGNEQRDNLFFIYLHSKRSELTIITIPTHLQPLAFCLSHYPFYQPRIGSDEYMVNRGSFKAHQAPLPKGSILRAHSEGRHGQVRRGCGGRDHTERRGVGAEGISILRATPPTSPSACASIRRARL